jgi:hypothetical protein
MDDNTILVGKVALRTAGTRSGMKRFRSRVNKITIQANSHIAKTNMFNTPGTSGESFAVTMPDPVSIGSVVSGVMGIVGIGILVGFYSKR